MDGGKAVYSRKGGGIWLWLVPLILLGLGFFGFRLFAASSSKEAEAPEPVVEQVSVTALGRLEPDGEVVAVGGPNSERLGRLDVAEGDFVKKGQILAYLESYDERKAERDYAASQLVEAQMQLRTETEYAQAQIQEAQTRVQQVDRPGNFAIQAQQAVIRQLEAQMELARLDLERNQLLQQEGAISRQELDQQVTQVRETQEELNNARATLIRLQEELNSDRLNARAQVRSAQANMGRSQAQIEVESAARNLRLAEARLERTLIRAPLEGEILRVITQNGEMISTDGIVEMGNTRQMNVVAEVYETDVRRIEVGQPATITSRNGAFDEALTGRVERIGSQIFKNDVLDDDPAANADARVLEVTIRMDDSAPVAKLTNLQVDVQIDVE